MNIATKHNIKITGRGNTAIIFAHGYGCDQKMWSQVAPAFEDRFKVILFDLVGSGGSDLGFYDKTKYGSLKGYAEDLVEMIEKLGLDKVVFVGHSVSATIGVIAANLRPDLFKMSFLIGPSPCYINQDAYVGGFKREDILGLLENMDSNFNAWAQTIAPVLTGNNSEASTVLASSFCSQRPDIARHFARVTFLADNREDFARASVPTVILQCREDNIAPESVGQYVHQQIKNSILLRLNATGHCPHITHPAEVIKAMQDNLL